MPVNFLDIKPEQAIDFIKRNNGLITILKPKFKNRLLTRYLLPRMKQPNFKINLDEVGSFVWKLCDGNTTVYEIGTEMQQHFGEKINPVYERLTMFLRQLHQNKFIEYRGPSD